MLYVLLLLLCISAVFFYLVFNRNILSVCVMAHLMYIISTLVMIWGYDVLKKDFCINTVVVILVSLFCIGLGELGMRHFYIAKNNKYYYPSPVQKKQFIITNTKFNLSVIGIFFLLLYQIYAFNIQGAYLGGYDFVSNYIAIRTSYVASAQGVDVDYADLPFGNIMAYFTFFMEILVYFYVYLYLYNKNFNVENYKRNNRWNLLPLILFFFICVLSTERLMFIRVMSVCGIMSFIMMKQANRAWRSRKYDKKILKKGGYIVLAFMLIFIIVGRFKEHDVSSAFKANICGYAGGGLIGLDMYMDGRIQKQSEYIGQETFRYVYVALKKLGIEYDLSEFHQHEYVWGINGEESNIFASPYYVLIDFPHFVLIPFYILLGAISSFLMYGLKFGKFQITDGAVYIVCSLLYYPIILIAITEEFHNLVFCSIFFYYLISIYVVKKCFCSFNNVEVNRYTI